MVISLETVYSTIMSEPDNMSSIIVEEFLSNIGLPPNQAVPNFHTKKQAVIWLGVFLLEHNIYVVFRSKCGNERVMADLREMVYEAYNMRKWVRE